MNGMHPQTRWNIVYWILAAMAFLALQNVWQAQRTVEPVPYSEFEKALAEGRVAEVVVGETTITGKLKSADGTKTTIVATRVEPVSSARVISSNRMGSCSVTVPSSGSFIPTLGRGLPTQESSRVMAVSTSRTEVRYWSSFS